MYKAWVQPLHQVWYWSTEGVKTYWVDNTVGSKEWYDLDVWTCDLKINKDNLLIGCNPCIKFGIDQLKGSKDIEQTTHWARKSGMTLTFEHVTWNSIGIIYLLREIPAPSLVLIKWRGQNILSGQHTWLWRVVWPWLWSSDLKINRDHLLIDDNPYIKFGTDQVKGSRDIERTTLGLQTDRLTDRHTDRQLQNNMPLFQGGHNNRLMFLNNHMSIIT